MDDKKYVEQVHYYEPLQNDQSLEDITMNTIQGIAYLWLPLLVSGHFIEDKVRAQRTSSLDLRGTKLCF